MGKVQGGQIIDYRGMEAEIYAIHENGSLEVVYGKNLGDAELISKKDFLMLKKEGLIKI